MHGAGQYSDFFLLEYLNPDKVFIILGMEGMTEWGQNPPNKHFWLDQSIKFKHIMDSFQRTYWPWVMLPDAAQLNKFKVSSSLMIKVELS